MTKSKLSEVEKVAHFPNPTFVRQSKYHNLYVGSLCLRLYLPVSAAMQTDPAYNARCAKAAAPPMCSWDAFNTFA